MEFFLAGGLFSFPRSFPFSLTTITWGLLGLFLQRSGVCWDFFLVLVFCHAWMGLVGKFFRDDVPITTLVHNWREEDGCFFVGRAINIKARLCLTFEL